MTIKAQGTLVVSVESIVKVPLAARVRLISDVDNRLGVFEIPQGEQTISFAEGSYTAAIYVYDAGVPVLIHAQPVVISHTLPVQVRVSLLEGSGGRSLRQFDGDFDLALDRVEMELGSDPRDPRSVPAEQVLAWPSPVLSDKGAWYSGELHAYSSYGRGSETVSQVVKRAEAAGLDFLAITDANTLAAAFDPAFKSSKMVLIPAMEWKHPQLGTALVYAPGSLLPANIEQAEAQALANKLVAQGGLFAVAHPARPNDIWRWDLKNYAAMEVWFGGWRATPPISLKDLPAEYTRRNQRGEFVYAMSIVAATDEFSSNGQSSLYYDLEVLRGSKAAVIAGSGSKGKKEPLGQPLTHVWAREKSLSGILDGIRRGRTVLTNGPDAPFVEFMADIMADGTTDVGPGDMIPVNVKSRLVLAIRNGKGKRMEILFNGYPIKTRTIESDRLIFSMDETPGAMGEYRVRILQAPRSKGFGPSDVLTMTSPIYAQSYFIDDRGKGAKPDGWVTLENTWQDPSTVVEFDPSTLDPSQVITLDPKRRN